MNLTIKIEVDDEYADPSHSTGLTEEGYTLVSDALMSSIASGVIDISPGADDD